MAWAPERSGNDLPTPMMLEGGEGGGAGHALVRQVQAKVMMMLTVSIYVFLGFSYNLVYVGRVLPAVGKESLAAPLTMLFNLTYGLAIWSYVKAWSTNPGFVPQQWHDFVGKAGFDLLVSPPHDEWQPGQATFCKKCGCPRPERAHHCSICKACVLRYDHHCPWINNCVGICNHKYFILLALWSCVGSFVALFTSLPELVRCAQAALRFEEGFRLERHTLQASDVIVFLTSGVLFLFFAMVLSLLLSIHLPLAMNNVTSVECNYENMPNPFNLGDSCSNLAQLFGAFGADWLVPITPVRPLTDGVSFPRLDDEMGFQGDESTIISENWEDEAESIWMRRYRIELHRDQSGDGENQAGYARESTGTWGPTCLQRRSDRRVAPGSPRRSPRGSPRGSPKGSPRNRSPRESPRLDVHSAGPGMRQSREKSMEDASPSRSGGPLSGFSSLSRLWSGDASWGARDLTALEDTGGHYGHTALVGAEAGRRSEAGRVLVAL